ncbi:glycerophosphoryl diester phosphodiesterase [Sanguibacter keddieii DSM 10542]|uniref:Glycerophosphoryl diester phosphodiesterase n=1 Tax=Sanguibacter keddieii (strain ATCC 51767 / DSM 10542 / NCFB 3025 / ST-74) TaxID=446469 RepID=D1BH94_SANKS|nr:glycerophosphodiester phosphodiesterase family protein [Sanguibacter keddieii]ACZ21814.1 glycerophosphoryl diester phosphodiesterase [Sanguibacter keddieii DSM 10542]
MTTAPLAAPLEAQRSTRPMVIAHRGSSSLAPQNTLAAFESAWRSGADSIEIDIQLDADGAPVVIHDDTVDATTNGSGAVAEMHSDELRRLDAGSWFSPAYAGQRIPTFDEVLELLVAREGIELLLELKGDWDAAGVQVAVDAIRAAGLTGRVLAQSFSRETVAALRDVAPEMRRGLLVFEVDHTLLDVCAELGVVACNPHGGLLLDDQTLLPRLQAAGVQVMVWTANEPEHWALLVEARVDAIITDRPDALVGWLSATGAAPSPRG